MTAETDLLPLPEIERWHVTGDYAYPTEVDPEGWAVDYDAHVAAMQTYARANMEPLLAEIEALRAEVERLTFEMGCLQQQYDERTAYMIVHRGAGLACSDAVRSAYSDEHHRAERLAEALRLYMAAGFGNSTDFYKQAKAKRAATEALHPTAAQENDDA